MQKMVGITGVIFAAALCALPLFAAEKGDERPLGYTSLTEEIEERELKVKGKIPHWVTGTFVYNGPAYFAPGKDYFHNWFDGLAMLHGFSIEEGKVTYGNKFLDHSAFESMVE